MADGDVLTTGSAALQGRSAFYRNAGPDLTGLFIGDCGAFGIKTAATLRLSPEPHRAMASFAFADPVAMAEAIAQVQRTGSGATIVALDPNRSADAMASVGTAEAARHRLGHAAAGTIAIVAAAQPGAARQGLGVARHGGSVQPGPGPTRNWHWFAA